MERIVKAQGWRWYGTFCCLLLAATPLRSIRSAVVQRSDHFVYCCSSCRLPGSFLGVLGGGYDVVASTWYACVTCVPATGNQVVIHGKMRHRWVSRSVAPNFQPKIGPRQSIILVRAPAASVLLEGSTFCLCYVHILCKQS